jgi:hypothetical protein
VVRGSWKVFSLNEVGKISELFPCEILKAWRGRGGRIKSTSSKEKKCLL